MEYSNTAFGRVGAMSDNDGVTSSFNYDAYGRLIGTTDAANNETVLTYDNAGRIASQTSAMGRTTSFVYNSSGQPVLNNPGLLETGFIGFQRVLGRVVVQRSSFLRLLLVVGSCWGLPRHLVTVVV